MLFFLHGENLFKSREKLKELQVTFSQKNPYAEVCFFDFSEKKDGLFPLIESFASSGLFSNKKMIVIENFMKEVPAENQKVLLEKLKSMHKLKNDDELFLIFHEDNKPKKNLSLYKYLFLNSKKHEFNLLNIKELELWVSDYISKNHPSVSISDKIISMLVSYTGNDLFLLKNEIEKIANFKTKGTVLEEDIDLLVKSHIESTVFQTTEALLSKNKKMALKLLHEQLGKGEDPFYILSMYVYQIRTLLKISSSIENGNTDTHSIAKETGIHPFVIQKSISQARLAGTEKLKGLFDKLKSIDMETKTGARDIKLSLDKFIAQI